MPAQTTTDPATGPTADDLFNDDAVQQVQLFVNSKDWKELQETYRENTYYPADLHWNGMVVRNIGIRSRGTGSRNPIKPGLRLDFDRYSTTQKFLGLKSFILDNLVQDLPMMQERLVMSLPDEDGTAGAARGVHTGLWVNNEFIGLYTIVESIDKDFLERTFGERRRLPLRVQQRRWLVLHTTASTASLDNLSAHLRTEDPGERSAGRANWAPSSRC